MGEEAVMRMRKDADLLSFRARHNQRELSTGAATHQSISVDPHSYLLPAGEEEAYSSAVSSLIAL